MKASHLKSKACLEIFLVLSLIFITSISLRSVRAAEPTSCCTQAQSGEYCVENLPEDQCKPGMYATTSCSLTAGCGQTGCCITSDQQCSMATTKASCDANNGVFHAGASCTTIEACQPRCCVNGNNCNLQTSYQCSQDGGELRTDITTEQACTNYCAQNDQGCCSTTCSYGLASTCAPDQFFKSIQCSKVSACKEQCTSHAQKRCGDDGSIYWYDSCGNKEELSEACDPDGRRGPSTECLATTNNDARCENTDCATSWDNPVVDEAGTADGGDSTGADLTNDKLVRKNRDSWCEYQAAVGPTLDLPGTQHYRHYCERGKEKVEPCGPDRERICLYGKLTLSPTEQKAIGACVPNTWHDCGKCDNQNCCEDPEKRCVWLPTKQETIYKQEGDKITTTFRVAYDPEKQELLVQNERKGFESRETIGQAYLKLEGPTSTTKSFSSAKKTTQQKIDLYTFDVSLEPGDYTIKACKKDNNCETLSKQTITPAAISELTQGKGLCTPVVPPESTDQCKLATEKLYYSEAAYWEEAWWNPPWDEDWSCSQGCDVYKDEFKKGTNIQCNAFGNCGAKYNLAGIFSNKGYRRDCAPGGADYKDIEKECPPGSNYLPASLIPFDVYKNAGQGLNILSIDLSQEFGIAGQITTKIVGGVLATLGGVGALALFGGISAVFFGGGAASSIIYTIITLGGLLAPLGPLGVIIFVVIVLVVIIAAIFILSSSDQKRDIAAYCSAWEPPKGGADCWKCHTPQKNGGILPDPFAFNYTGEGSLPQYECTEQLCASLGSYCTFVQDAPQGPQCGSKEPYDVIPPSLEAIDAKYTCNDASPGQVGNCNLNKENRFEISGNLKEFSTINITLKSVNPETKQDELAHCKFAIGIQHRDAPYEEMQPFKEGDVPSILHTLSIANIGQNKTHNYYAKCKDISDNIIQAPYLISFTSALQPDKTPPTIVRFIPPQEKGYVKHGATSFPIMVETNEDVPLGSSGGCRWANKTNTPFETMRFLTCQSATLHHGPQCDGPITGITQPSQTVFFKCQDTAIPPNTMQQDLPYTIKQSDALTITTVQCTTLLSNACTSSMYGDEINVTLQTSGGIENGKATCSYQLDRGSTIEMFETTRTTHKQLGIRPSLLQPTHTLFFTCADAIGNAANTTLPFELIKDTAGPKILTSYTGNNLLTVTTNEKAACRYTRITTTNQTAFSLTNALTHNEALRTNNYFAVSCSDLFQNVGSTTKITII